MRDQFESSILDKICTDHLPTLPPGAPGLLKKLSNEETDFKELVEIIGRFPSIIARLLALANSAWSSPVSSITSLEDACSRLGFSIVKSTSIALTVATPFNPNKCPSFDPLNYWTNAFMSAEAAASLVLASPSIRELQPSSASTAGILHNLGLLWLADRLPDEMGEAIEMVKQDSEQTLRGALRETIGVDYAQASGRLAQNWELPESMVDAMGKYPEIHYQGAHREVVHSVGLAAELVSAAWAGESCPPRDLRVASLGLQEADMKLIFDQQVAKLPKITDLARTLFS